MKACWNHFHKPPLLNNILSITGAVLLHITLNQTEHLYILTAKNCCLYLNYQFCTQNGTSYITTGKLNNYKKKKGTLCAKFQLFLT